MRIALFGAGQAGRMAAAWLPARTQLLCFIDNAPEKQGTALDGVPVLSLEGALALAPDAILLTILNRESAAQVRDELSRRFSGIVWDVRELQQLLDLRLAALRLLTRQLTQRNVPGAIAELGVYQGEFAAEMNRLLPDRPLYLFDTFSGFDPRDLSVERQVAAQGKNAGPHAEDFSDTSVERVRQRLPYPHRAVFCPGYFPDSLALLPQGLPSFALVSLDLDLYAPTYAALKRFVPRLSPGGAALIHDYDSQQFPGVRLAVDRFCREEGRFLIPLMDLHGTVLLPAPQSPGREDRPGA